MLPARQSRALRGVDLFSGPGGLTLGLKKAGVIPVCAVEFSRDAIQTYQSHTPEAVHFCEDIRKVDFRRYRGKIDIVYGGPPCQPFSTGGLRRGTKDQRNMFPAFLETVRLLMPDVVLVENVPGLATAARIAYLQEILSDIARLGYKPSWRILNAANYGVPQSRRRLFIVAFREKQFWFPKPTHGPGTGRPLTPSKSVLSSEPIGEPPNCSVVYAKYPDLRPSPYAGHLYNGQGRPINPDAPCHTILASSGGYKTHWVDTQNVAPKYHRHLVGGGAPWEGAVPGARRLTVEESALIQTFPKRLRFAGSRSSQYTQVGDAVPPLLAQKLGTEVVRQYFGQEPKEATHYPPEAVATRLW